MKGSDCGFQKSSLRFFLVQPLRQQCHRLVHVPRQRVAGQTIVADAKLVLPAQNVRIAQLHSGNSPCLEILGQGFQHFERRVKSGRQYQTSVANAWYFLA
jgi:hypothetical protein